MPGNRALSRSVEALLEADGDDGQRYVDLGVSLRLCDTEADERGNARWLVETDEELLVVGGRWDRRAKDWESGPSRLVDLRLHRGQEESARWIAEWIRRMAIGKKGAHWRDPMPGGTPKVETDGPAIAATQLLLGNTNAQQGRDFALLLIGGRRSGKSHMSLVALVLYAVMTAGSLIWAISPTQPRTDELQQALFALMPPRWYRFHRGNSKEPPHFTLVNGSRIMLVSGHKSEALKNGKCDLALYNEAQNMSVDGFAQLHGAIGDSGGLVILAANPPSKPIGRWVEELFDLSRAGKTFTQTFQLTPRKNPFIDLDALAAMARNILDPITFRREVLGEMLPIGDIVFHCWSSTDSVKLPPPEFVDVTAEVTKRVLGRAFGDVLGMDFQHDPANAVAVYRFFRDPDGPDEIIPWIVDEVWCEDSNELELLDELERKPRWQLGGARDSATYRGWVEPGDDAAKPVHCAVVMDASAWWQDSQHTGKQSDRMLRSRNWKYLYQPQPWRRDDGAMYRNNPPIVERCKVTNARLLNAAGVRRMFVAPHCTGIIRAMKNWPNNKTGVPDRRSEFAHLCDAVSYVIYRFFAKLKPQGGSKYQPLNRFTRDREF